MDAQDSSLQSQINQKAATTYVNSALAEQTQTVNTALSQLSTAANKFYPTLVAANTDIANIAINQPVQVGETGANGGLWYKATAGATSLTKDPYDPLTQAKLYTDYIDQKNLVNLQSFGSEILTITGSFTNTNNTQYSRSGLIPIHSSRLLKIETQVYGIDHTCEFYNIRKEPMGRDVVATPYNGIITKYVLAPKDACFIRIMSANSTQPGYIPYSFSFEIFRKEFQNDTNELTIDYERLDKEGVDGSSLSSASLYKYLILPVIAGQTITYRELRTSGTPSVIVYDESYNVLQSHNEFSKTVVLPTNAKYVLIQAFAKTHASYSSERASKMYFKRGYVDLLENVETRLSVKQLSNEIEILKRGNTLSFTDEDFTVSESVGTYNRTPKIETFGMRKLYIRGLLVNQGSVVRTFNAEGNITYFVMGSAGINRYNSIYELPADAVAVDVNFMSESHTLYNPNYGRYVVLGRSEEDIFNELNSIVDNTIRSEFQIKNTHAFSNAKTYDSVRIPVYPSMQLKYSVAANGGSGLIVYDDGTREHVYENAKTISFDRFGYITLSTYNSTHDFLIRISHLRIRF